MDESFFKALENGNTHSDLVFIIHLKNDRWLLLNGNFHKKIFIFKNILNES